MESVPFFMVGPVEPLTVEAIALACDGDRRDVARGDVLIVRMR
jgi:hypothetical protein